MMLGNADSKHLRRVRGWAEEIGDQERRGNHSLLTVDTGGIRTMDIEGIPAMDTEGIRTMDLKGIQTVDTEGIQTVGPGLGESVGTRRSVVGGTTTRVGV